MSTIVRLSDYRTRRSRVYFNRTELSALLAVYSERVARGEWKDYAIDHHPGVAVFSVFRHTADRPAYAVAKSVGPSGPEYAVFDQNRRLKKGGTLTDILAALPSKLLLVRD